MSSPQVPCPAHSILYNKTLCACAPGYLFNATIKSCTPFSLSSYEFVVNSGVDYSISFPETIFSFDQIKKFTQSQAVFLETTAVLLVSWLLFCGFVRLGKLGDGKTVWFKIRWWITRLDISFATKHWLEDQHVVRKRKTELGGAFSIASWIVFVGLLSALLYQIIFKRTVEVYNLRATNAPDLVAFVNDLEFNITTMSTMSCSQLRGLGTLVLGNPGSIDYRMTRLSTFANYSCFNTSQGPRISLKCNSCPLTRDNVYISWQFVDIPNEPASAVGFQFNLTARKNAQNKHVSVVSGTVRNRTADLNDIPVTFRGLDTNILKFNLFPKIYRKFHNLKLVQPLFHEFLPGSFITDAKALQTSLQTSNNGLINTTLSINFLSDYIVEIDSQNILGPVSFLADLGGLYCFSIGIFFYFLVQFEFRIKRLRNEDQVFMNIRRRRKAQEHWEKLRKYVIYTWAPRALLEDNFNGVGCFTCVGVDPFRKKESLDERMKWESSLHDINFEKNGSLPKEIVNNNLPEPGRSTKSSVDIASRHLSSKHELDDIPPPPPELIRGSSTDMSEIQKNLQNLYDYNVLLRNKLVHTQSMLHALSTKYPSPAEEGNGQASR